MKSKSMKDLFGNIESNKILKSKSDTMEQKRKTSYINDEAIDKNPKNQIKNERLKEQSEDKLGIEVLEACREILANPELQLEDVFVKSKSQLVKIMSFVSFAKNQYGVNIDGKEVFQAKNIKAISTMVSIAIHEKRKNSNDIIRVEKKNYYKTSSSQKRMYILNQMNKNSIAYNMPIVIKITGQLDTKRIEETVVKIVERHEILRTCFQVIDSEIVQKINDKPYIDIEYSNLNNREVETALNEALKPFDLSKGPIIRLHLIKVNQQEHIMMLDTHHIASDGFSNRILMQEFMSIYGGFEPAKLPLQYKDYAEWEYNFLQSDQLEKQKNYWQEVFKKDFNDLEMPLDFERPEKRAIKGAKVSGNIKKELVDKVNTIAKENGLTLNSVLFMLYQVLLSKYNGQKDIVSGLIVAGRKTPELENLIGVFMNFIPIRNEIGEQSTLKEVINSGHKNILTAFENSDYPFDEIVKDVVDRRRNDRNALIDTMFIFHNEYNSKEAFKLGDLDVQILNVMGNDSKLDFQMDVFLNKEGGLTYFLEYNTTLFKEESMKKFAEHFINLMRLSSEVLEKKMVDINLFSQEESNALDKKRERNNKLIKKKLVVTSTFTDEPIKEYVEWWTRKFNYHTNIEFAPYNQVFQQLIDPMSLVNRNKDINLLMVRFEDWIRNVEDKSQHRGILEKNYEELIRAIRNKNEESSYITTTFPLNGNCNLDEEVSDYISVLNNQFKEDVKDVKKVYPIDFREINTIYNVNDIFDDYTDKEGHMPFSRSYYGVIGTNIARKICAIKGNPFKVIVLDCDNTLWGGVCGEAGTHGIDINDNYRAFQEFLIEKYNEGMVLALCSKNNENDVLEVLEKNEQMLIKKEHIAAMRVNWNSKAENIKELSEELNLGLDSFIFLDDSGVECLEVMNKCPDVLTLQLPKNPSMIPIFMKHIWALDKENVTAEDKKRTRMYMEEKQRNVLKKTDISLESFLKSLELKMSIRKIEAHNIPRASQLTQRTNQFNLSTIRRTEEDIKEIINDCNKESFIVEVKDRFGAYGIVGLIILENRENSTFIDTFLLSCRVLGRGIEKAVLGFIAEYSKTRNIDVLKTNFIETAKNKPFKDFIDNSKWTELNRCGKKIELELGVGTINENVDFIDLYINEAYKKEAVENKKVIAVSTSKKDETQPKENDNNREKIGWNVFVENKENLRHKDYLFTLELYDSEKILDLPVFEAIDAKSVAKAPYVAPRNQLEKMLVGIWKEILQVDHIGIKDNFFDLGGQSLNATVVLSKICKELDVDISLKDIFYYPTIEGLCQVIIDSDNIQHGTIEKVNQREFYEASSAQKRMYILQQFDKRSVAYNMPFVFELEGKIDKERLEKTFRKLIERHESFRTSFQTIDGEIVQKIDDTMQFDLIEKESTNIDETISAFVQPFDLEKPGLIRAKLVKHHYKTYLLLDMHHIISDGVSSQIFIQEFGQIYNGKDLRPLEVQYKDFAHWQNSYLDSEEIKEEEKYWIEKFNDDIPQINLPYDYNRPSIQSFEGDELNLKISKTLKSRIDHVKKETGTTTYMVLLSAINILISKYSGDEDIVVGTPIAGRLHNEVQDVMGMFVNTLAIRNYPRAQQAYNEFLSEVKVNALKAYENQNYPFETLVDKLELRRDLGRNPLFDVLFNMMDVSNNNEIALEDITFKYYNRDKKITKFDLNIKAVEKDNEIDIIIEYCSKLFKKSTIERLGNHLINILEGIAENTKVKIAQIGLLEEAEKNRILTDFNNTVTDYPKNKTIIGLFEEQVEKTPNHIAAVFENQEITYKALNEKANAFGRMLRTRGAKPDSPVGLMVEKSLDMLAGILGILKAGAGYMPINPELPQNKIQELLNSSQSDMLVTQNNLLKNTVFEGEIVLLDEKESYDVNIDNLDTVTSENHLVYVIYTSGTTGNPKGIMVENKNLVNLALSLKESIYDKINHDINVSMVSPYYFDASVKQIYPALITGSTLHLISKDRVLDGKKLIDYYETNAIHIADGTPSHLSILKSVDWEVSDKWHVKSFLIGGEILQRKIANYISRKTGTNIINVYGPTECCDVATMHLFNPNRDSHLSSVPIGNPINNVSIYILDKNLQICPLGVKGEIYIGGAGVSRGYLNNLAQTMEKFIDNPFIKGERIYKTGDMGRWLEDGKIDILGRIDQQVKLRGFRIELKEIEDKLLSHSSVKEAAVIVRENSSGEGVLGGYIVVQNNYQEETVLDYLKDTLPDYMLPSYLKVLDSLPLTKNGKLDQKRLPEISFKASMKKYEAPSTTMEKKLVEIWMEVLKVDRIGIEDNFFELGGHSLKAAIMTSKIRKELNIEVSVKTIFKFATIKSLSRVLENTEDNFYSKIEPVEEKSFYRTSSAQKRMYILYQMDKESLAYNMPMAVKITGKLDLVKIKESILKVVERHEALRSYFEIIDNEIVQKIENQAQINIDYAKPEASILQNVIDEFVKPFDLDKGPLLRAKIVEVSENEHLLLIDIHHIASDGISKKIFINEILNIYNDKALLDLPLQYKDYAEWEYNLLDSEIMQSQKEYWQKRFESKPKALNMPLDFNRTKDISGNGDRLQGKVHKKTIEQLESLAIENGITLNSVLFMLYQVLLSKYSGEQDITSGLILGGRNYYELENLIGVFMNFLPIRNNIGGEITLKEIIKDGNKNIVDAYENGNYPYHEMVKDVLKERDNNRNALMDTMFIFHNQYNPNEKYELGDLQVENLDISHKLSKLDFQMDATLDHDGNLIYYLEYNTSLYAKETMEMFARHFDTLLEVACENLDNKVEEIDIFTKAEIDIIEGKRKLADEDNATQIVIASTFTDLPVERYIKWWTKKFNHDVDVKFAEYNQVFQELLDENSLVRKNEDINVIMVRFEDWIRAVEDEKEHYNLIERNYEDFIQALKGNDENSACVIATFPINENTHTTVEVKELILTLTKRLKDDVKEIPKISVLDFNEINPIYNITNMFDELTDREAHMPFTSEYYGVLGTNIARKICALKGNPFKVIVLDCDNTLWGGVCGEAGVHGIDINPDYQAFQKFLIDKHEDGMLLALCSKNNKEDVLEVLEKNEQMLLKKEHIAAMQVNWNSKGDNIRVLAQELNLGLDSFIFIDDSSLECLDVVNKCPEVLTLQVPKDSNMIMPFVKHIWALDKENITYEDRNRTKMYMEEKQRNTLKESDISIENFLESLELKMSMRSLEEKNIGRASQLTQRTNQFNLSTIRRTEDEIKNLMHKEGSELFIVEVKDRFGEYGIVGLIILENRAEEIFIDTFLLSCRVLGRGVEKAILNLIGKHCKEKGIDVLKTHYIETAKNKPFKKFIEESQWVEKSKEDKITELELMVGSIEEVSFIESYFKDTYENNSVIDEVKQPKEFKKVEAYASLKNDTDDCVKKVLEWDIFEEKLDSLHHKNYIFPLNKYSAKDLMDLPIAEEISNIDIFRAAYEAPRNETESNLVKLWEDILDIDKIGINDNFFRLGGQSLTATALISRIHKEFNVEVKLKDVFNEPTIKGLSAILEKGRKNIYSDIVPVEDKAYYHTSSSQKRMYILEQMDNGGTAYNMPMALKAIGKLDVDKVINSVEKIVERHEILRTYFEIKDDKILQRIRSDVHIDTKYSKVGDKKLDDLLSQVIKPFDLNKGPIIRLEILEINQSEHILLLDTHHIASDGFSTVLMMKEIISLYNGEKLEPLDIQYRDYAEWEYKYLNSDNIKEQKEYWNDRFKDEPKPLEMPLDFARPKQRISIGEKIHDNIGNEIVAGIRDIALKNNVTLNSVLFMLYEVLLSKYSDQSDVTSGLIVAGRNKAELDKNIGVFMNFLPIRNQIENEKSLLEVIIEGNKNIMDAYEHCDYPFHEIVNDVVENRDNSRNALMDTMFILHNEYNPNEVFELENVTFENIDIMDKGSKLDFQLDAYMEKQGGLRISLEYNKTLYKRESMENFIRHFKALLEMAPQMLNDKLSDIQIFTSEEKQLLEAKRGVGNEKPIQVVISSTFTDSPVEKYIKWWMNKFDYDVDIRFTHYNQVFQEMLNKDSILSQNKDINVIMVRFEDWIRSVEDKEQHYRILERNYEDFINALKGKEKNSKYIITTFKTPSYLNLDDRVLVQIKELNHRLKEDIKAIENVYNIDFEEVNGLYNIEEIFDELTDKEGHMPFTSEYYGIIGTNIARKICALRRNPFKVIILDCDNTLWSGVCGEAGTFGIDINSNFKAFHRFLIEKYNDGVLLALCSKNNEEDVLEVFDKNQEMILKKDHIAAMRVNWNSKAENIKALAKELNLGLDSFVFIDDSSMECLEVMNKCPEVLTIQLPEDSNMIPIFMKHIWALDTGDVTNEDKVRSKMYMEEKERTALRESDISMESFLEGLELKMSMRVLDNANIGRASQLTQRTNQFNLSTIRRTDEEIRDLIKDKTKESFIVEVKDRFGEYGIVGLIVLEDRDEHTFIETFLLSCRVLGRGIEKAILSTIAKRCKKKKINVLKTNFIKTAKNKPFETFLNETSWKIVDEIDKKIQLELMVDEIENNVSFVEVYFNAIYNQEQIKDQSINISVEEQRIITAEKTSLLEGENVIKDEQGKVSNIKWDVLIENETNLIHKNHLIALKQYDSKKMLSLALTDKLNKKEIIKVEYVSPRNKMEEILVKVWEEVLEVDDIGVNDNFFDLGGSSLKVIKAVSSAKKAGIEISVSNVIQNGTIRKIADACGEEYNIHGLIDDIYHQSGISLLKKSTQKEPKRVFIFPGLMANVGNHLLYKALTDRLGDYEFHLLYFTGRDNYIKDCIKSIKSIQNGGKYVFMGFSIGGSIGVEVAREMAKEGLQVGDTILLESPFVDEDFGQKLSSAEMRRAYLNYYIEMDPYYAHMVKSERDMVVEEFVNSTKSVEDFRSTEKAYTHLHWVETENAIDETHNIDYIRSKWMEIGGTNFTKYDCKGTHSSLIRFETLEYNAMVIQGILEKIFKEND